ncbi:hypothetical protein [Paraburkholderia sp. C35]|uniref:hypothetical protein n=1 Tax=Paraburkholderia sp. C35 TaxID=2126993 RepID=UPI0013A5450C|nr:hypothetical protein [Paraburkholderia sp. C35]
MNHTHDDPEQADVRRIADDIRSALASGLNMRAVESRYGRSLQAHSAEAGHLALIGAQTCWSMGRRKETRAWLDMLIARQSVLAPEDLAAAVSVTASAGQAQMVLGLSRLLREQPPVASSEAVDACTAMIELALRLRIPRARNGAWSVHRTLLEEASKLLDTLPAGDQTDGLKARARSLLLSRRERALRDE